MTEQSFLDLKNQALPLVQNKIKLDRIILDHHLYGFHEAPGLFLIMPELATPLEMAIQLAIRQIEADAYASFLAGFEQAKALRNFQPQRGAMQ